MEALEVESQTDQTPLKGLGLDTSQRELTEAQHLLDDADHRFDSAFACAVDGFAQRGSELVGHLEPSSSHPQAAGLAAALLAVANWDDGDHGPWRYMARCCV